MSTTGSDLKRIYDSKIDKAYSAYMTNTEYNDILKQALFLSVQDVYQELSDQVDYDDLLSALKTEQVFGLNNNKIYVTSIPISDVLHSAPFTATITTAVPHNLKTGDIIGCSAVSGITVTPDINTTTFSVTVTSATTFTIVIVTTAGTHTPNTGGIDSVTSSTADDTKIISDYGDLLSLKAKFLQGSDIKITGASNTQPIRITVNRRNNLKTGEKINISGVVGNSNANGDHYIKVISSTKFDLYEDKDLLIGKNGNGVFGGVGALKRIYYKVATPYLSSRKISVYEQPTTQNPQFERADLQLKVYPADSVCSEITVDYLRYDLTPISVTDTALDLEQYYSYEFLMYVTDKASQMFFMRTKDVESFQVSQIQEQAVK
jgi:hypothetical protein